MGLALSKAILLCKHCENPRHTPDLWSIWVSSTVHCRGRDLCTAAHMRRSTHMLVQKGCGSPCCLVSKDNILSLAWKKTKPQNSKYAFYQKVTKILIEIPTSQRLPMQCLKLPQNCIFWFIWGGLFFIPLYVWCGYIHVLHMCACLRFPHPFTTLLHIEAEPRACSSG